MKLFDKNFEKLHNDERLERYGIQINIIGRIWMFPKNVQEKMNKIMKKTKNNSNFIINFAMAYGGQQEVVDAAKKIAEKVKEGSLKIEDINEETFSIRFVVNT